MPVGFQLLSWFPTAVQAWIPVAWTPQEPVTRGNHNFRVVARLRPEVLLFPLLLIIRAAAHRKRLVRTSAEIREAPDCSHRPQSESTPVG